MKYSKFKDKVEVNMAFVLKEIQEYQMYEGRGLDLDARSVKSSDNNNKASKSSHSKLTRQNSAFDQR